MNVQYEIKAAEHMRNINAPNMNVIAATRQAISSSFHLVASGVVVMFAHFTKQIVALIWSVRGRLDNYVWRKDERIFHLLHSL